MYERLHAKQPSHIQALEYALEAECDAYLANDWDGLPIAAQAAARHHAKVVFDAHEYGPLEYENRSDWWLYEPMIRYLLLKYAPAIDASMTVAPAIADRYREEFGLDPIVLLNAPERVPLPPQITDDGNIRLIHHGLAAEIRRPKHMIDTIALCDQRYSLHFMLMPTPYIEQLRKYAEQIARGRVFFHDHVPPDRIVTEIAAYDAGFCYIAPTNYNYLVCLPNKFFDYIMAGLAVCTGPSPCMAEVVRQYKCGCVFPSFDPHDMAATLNRIDFSQWASMRQAAREASEVLNAKNEMQKLVEIFQGLLGIDQGPS
jgi:glycosyltransferase involved in cell wall biosynthesis